MNDMTKISVHNVTQENFNDTMPLKQLINMSKNDTPLKSDSNSNSLKID